MNHGFFQAHPKMREYTSKLLCSIESVVDGGGGGGGAVEQVFDPLDGGKVSVCSRMAVFPEKFLSGSRTESGASSSFTFFPA